MIEKYVSDLAVHMKVPLTDVSIVDVNPIPKNPSVHLLKLWCGGHISTTLLWQEDLDRLQSGLDCNVVESKVIMALQKLKKINDVTAKQIRTAAVSRRAKAVKTYHNILETLTVKLSAKQEPLNSAKRGLRSLFLCQ